MANLTPLEIAQLMANVSTNVTLPQYATGVSIAIAESGGNPAAVGSDPHDRGLWQINSVAHPDISDAVAFDPQASTAAVFQMTDGFQIAKFNQIWVDAKGTKSKGLDPANVAKASQEIAVPLAEGHITSGGLDPGGVIAKVGGAVSALTPDWIGQLGSLLSNLLSGTWWKRIGIGALGVAVIIVALILLFGKDVEKAAVA